MAGTLTISNFRLDNRTDLQADITWDPAHPGDKATANMEGDYSPEETWLEHNGGLAFLTVKREGSNLRFETWGTDTNGDYSAEAIDIFTLPIDLTKPFPATLANKQVPSPHDVYTYVLLPLPDNPNGFRLKAGSGAPLPVK